jgi:hypothetical protein
MPELHHFYHNIGDRAARQIAEGSHDERAAASLLLHGVGFSNNYTRFNRLSKLILPSEIDEASGMMPLVGLDLSRVVDLGRLSTQDRTASLVPSGMEAVEVADWYVGDSYLKPGSERDVLVGGYSKERDMIIGETILHAYLSNIFLATQIAIETGVVDAGATDPGGR